MNILYVANSFLEKNKATTGLPMYLYKVSIALQKLGHKVVIVAGGVCTGISNIDGITVHTVAVFHNPHEKNIIINAKDILLTSYKLNKEVKRIYIKEKIDIIQYASPYGLGIFYHFPIPAVIRLSWYAKIYFYPYKTFTKQQVKLFTLAEKFPAHKVSGIFGPGKVIAKEYSRDTNKKVYIIETPYENDITHPDNSVFERCLKDKKYILYFGALLAEKGIFVIGECIYDILKEYSDYYFVFAGENVEYDGIYSMSHIKKMAKEYVNHVIYLGRLERSKLFPIIQNAQLITLPSIMENFANACVEAMAMGKIVVGTDGATYEQLIKNGISGFLAKPGDSTSLKNCIINALNQTDENRKKMELAAQKRIELLRPEITVKKLLNFYQYIIDGYYDKRRN